jgi:hypothetical protein
MKISNQNYTLVNMRDFQSTQVLPPIPAPAIVFLGALINLRAKFNLRLGEFIVLSAGIATRNVFCGSQIIFVGSQRLRFFGDFVIVNCPTL